MHSILSQMDLVYILPPYFFKYYFNILPSIPISIPCVLRAPFIERTGWAGGVEKSTTDDFIVSGGSVAEQLASSFKASHLTEDKIQEQGQGVNGNS